MNKTSAPGRTGFAAFRLQPALSRGIEAAGFDVPRPIQAQAIPAALDGRDILGLAQTGTGKTAAFALPLLDAIVRRRQQGPSALVLAPTRELATQIDAEMRSLARYTKVSTLTVFGGVPMGPQMRRLRARPDVLVACPGRLLDLADRGCADLSRIETLVLDEADHMFDMGFLPALRKILSLLPRRRQNLLFSATMPREIRRLADEILVSPKVIELSDSRPAVTIEHALYPVRPDLKRELLTLLLSAEDCRSAIVFTRTKRRARSLATSLVKSGHRAVALQGNMSQSQRDRAMRSFRDGRSNVLVATDIVARGIDVSDVSYVINFDAPDTPEAYTHRIGRTGRAERAGRACTMVSHEDRDWVRDTERFLGGPIRRQEVEGLARDGEPHSSPIRSRPLASRTEKAVAPRSSRGRRRRRGSRRAG